MKCVSLFSCAGFGDLGIEAAGIKTISACELLPERADMLRKNFPDTRVFQGDVWDLQDDIVQHALDQLQGEQLFLVIASPPCQGYSSNGMGRITNEVKKGKRPRDDPRNRLIVPALNIIKKLRPRFFIIENVQGMKRSLIMNDKGQYENVFSILHNSLPEFVIKSTILNAADYGVPQTRHRLITIGVDVESTDENVGQDIYSDQVSFLHAFPTHVSNHICLKNAISHLAPLDSFEKLQDDNDVYHKIPKWNEMQYRCMSHTPEGETAFHNTTCFECGFVNEDFKVIKCKECGSFLPRPLLKRKDGTLRLIRAFKTSYRRMFWNRPANALTTNSGVISSDVKGHPTENRVLSLREIMIVASISSYPNSNQQSFEYNFDGCSDKLIREVIGECIPPLLTYELSRHLIDIYKTRT